jgi:hypothetical protein
MAEYMQIAATPPPSAAPAQHRHGRTRCARYRATRDPTSARSTPPSHPSRSSLSAHTGDTAHSRAWLSAQLQLSRTANPQVSEPPTPSRPNRGSLVGSKHSQTRPAAVHRFTGRFRLLLARGARKRLGPPESEPRASLLPVLCGALRDAMSASAPVFASGSLTGQTRVCTT